MTLRLLGGYFVALAAALVLAPAPAVAGEARIAARFMQAVMEAAP